MACKFKFFAGPYTIFVPTDKAFRTLLVQLGGPEKAEQKFRDNPRLLSGVSFSMRVFNYVRKLAVTFNNFIVRW